MKNISTYLGFCINLSNDFVLKFVAAIFLQSIKWYETQGAYRKTKSCLSDRQSIGIEGVSCDLCQYQ